MTTILLITRLMHMLVLWRDIDGTKNKGATANCQFTDGMQTKHSINTAFTDGMQASDILICLLLSKLLTVNTCII